MQEDYELAMYKLWIMAANESYHQPALVWVMLTSNHTNTLHVSPLSSLETVISIVRPEQSVPYEI